MISVIVSLLLSAFIGYEREKEHKPAGIRTVMLVTLGATLFALIGLSFTGQSNLDALRLFYAPIIGVGFLGSGVIFNKGKNNVEGITTASVLWVMVAVGLLCGIQYYKYAVVATSCVWLILKSKHIIYRIKGEKYES